MIKYLLSEDYEYTHTSKLTPKNPITKQDRKYLIELGYSYDKDDKSWKNVETFLCEKWVD